MLQNNLLLILKLNNYKLCCDYSVLFLNSPYSANAQIYGFSKNVNLTVTGYVRWSLGYKTIERAI